MTDEERAKQHFEHILNLADIGRLEDGQLIAAAVSFAAAVRADATKLEREALAEKARAVLEHFRTSHAMHWDREGTHGSNCPACKIDRETREMLRAMVKP